MAKIIQEASYVVVFTGAGISTSTGLPDYRGENGLRTRKRQRTAIPDLNLLQPSPTHMILKELHRLGYIKHIITQNVDNLHRKSGIPQNSLTELHGNAAFAQCDTCEFLYQHSFPLDGLCKRSDCSSSKQPLERRMKARTRHGNGRLKRYVVGFGDEIEIDTDHSERADVALVLGTSLRVEPFASLATAHAKHILIVNKGPTTSVYDKAACIRLDEDCDTVMTALLRCLLDDPEYPIPQPPEHQTQDVFVPYDDESSAYLGNILAGGH